MIFLTCTRQKDNPKQKKRANYELCRPYIWSTFVSRGLNCQKHARYITNFVLRNECSLNWNRSERFTLNTANAGNRLTSTLTEPNDFVLVKVVCARRTAHRTSMWLCMLCEWFTVEDNLLVYGMQSTSIDVARTVVHEPHSSEYLCVSWARKKSHHCCNDCFMNWLMRQLQGCAEIDAHRTVHQQKAKRKNCKFKPYKQIFGVRVHGFFRKRATRCVFLSLWTDSNEIKKERWKNTHSQDETERKNAANRIHSSSSKVHE